MQLRNRKNRSEPSCTCRAGCVQAAPEEQNCCSLRPRWVWQGWEGLWEQEELQLLPELWAVSHCWGQEGQTSCLFVFSSSVLWVQYDTHEHFYMQDILSAVHAQCVCIKTWNAYENLCLAVPCCSLLMTPACSSLLICCQWSGAHRTSQQSVIWKKVLMLLPRNASVYPTLLLPASYGSVFHMAHSWDESFGTAAFD